MSRRRSAPVELTMFPFLSVLCALIGIFVVFIIMTLVTRVVGDPQPGDGGEGPGIPADQYKVLSLQVQQLAARLTSRRGEYSQLQAKYRDLEEQIRTKEDMDALPPPAPEGMEGTRIGAPENVVVAPDFGGAGPTKEPIFVEVEGNTLIVHPEKVSYQIAELDQAQSPLRRFISTVEQTRQQKYLLLLVHPNAVATNDRLQEFVRKAGITVGDEPFSSNWLLVPQQQTPKPK